MAWESNKSTNHSSVAKSVIPSAATSAANSSSRVGISHPIASRKSP
ncbi:hypothetical protein H6G72_08605 [Planktothricoides sp. FACHB-1370]|uniref:Uncharacterized protein n=1 Tax=Planktothricoides raciborskii FACHB-1370 TaxID=2949576 RepID=A0ABR8EDV5_9CYAN|nr:hypothetical protein [Planktothricoides raciborskii FACHB-1370]